MTALQISPKMESLYMDCVERPQGFATFTRLPFGQFSLKTFKLDWVSFHSVTSLVESQYVYVFFFNGAMQARKVRFPPDHLIA